MNNNIVLIMLMFFFAVLIEGCQYSEDSVFSAEQTLASDSGYDRFSLDVLVPALCVKSVKTTLNELKDSNGLDYEYRKIDGTQEAYNNIDGYVSLKVNGTYPKMYLYEVRVKLLNKCFATGSISIPRDGNEWRNLGDDIEDFKKRNITIHSIKVTDELIRLFVNMDEYRSAR